MKNTSNRKKLKRKLEKEVNALCKIAIDRLENKIKIRGDIKDVPENIWELVTL